MAPASGDLPSPSSAFITVFIVVCTAVTLSSSMCPTRTPPTSKCPCDTTEEGYVLRCPTFTVDVRSRSKVDVLCSTNDVNDFSELNGMHTEILTPLEMHQCQLPSVPMSRLMRHIGVSSARSLYLRNTMPLSDDIFTDMPFIRHIVLDYDNLVLPDSIFRGVPQLESLVLSTNSVTYLEAGVFRNLTQLNSLSLTGNFRNLSRAIFSGAHNLQRLVFKLNEMKEIPPDTFVDLKYLIEIHLIENKFISLPHDLFVNNLRLNTVALEGNKEPLETLPPRLLANIPSLNIIIITSCNISSLPEELFWDSTGTRNISLYNNTLTTLPQELFRDCHQLEILDLSFNRITDLPSFVFNATWKLKTLNISNNRLSIITNDFFTSLELLQILNLDYNRLKHIEPSGLSGLHSLKQINMANNFLTFEISSTSLSPLHSCGSLENIQLANNSVTTIFPDWRDRRRLETLNISHNNISRLESADLRFVGSGIITVDMRYNHISDLDILESEDDSVYRYVVTDKKNVVNHYGYLRPNHITFYIGGNPMNCGCEHYSLLEYRKNKSWPTAQVILVMENTDIGNTNKEYGLDNICKGVSVDEIPVKHLTCLFRQEYSTACPIECSCVFRPSDNAVSVDCAKSNLTSMPAALPDFWFSSHTELNVSGNRIKSVKSPLGPGYSKVTKYILSYNVISDIDLTAFSPKIQVLAIARNSITQFNDQSIEFLRNVTHLTELILYGNPWTCDCKTENFVTLIKSFKNLKKIKLQDNTTCKDGKLIFNISDTDLCPVEPKIKTVVDVVLTVAIVFAIAVPVGILLGLLALYYKFQEEIKIWIYAHHFCLRFITEDQLDRYKIYDAFVSYSQQNEDFVIEHLVPGLENGPVRYKLCLHQRDWMVGEAILTQISKSVEESRRTIVVLSPAFLESVWGRMEFQVAHRLALKERRVRVIIILYEDIEPTDRLDPELRAYLSMNTYVKWGDPLFWEKLRYALPHTFKRHKHIPLQEIRRPHLYLSDETNPLNDSWRQPLVNIESD